MWTEAPSGTAGSCPSSSVLTTRWSCSSIPLNSCLMLRRSFPGWKTTSACREKTPPVWTFENTVQTKTDTGFSELEETKPEPDPSPTILNPLWCPGCSRAKAQPMTPPSEDSGCRDGPQLFGMLLMATYARPSFATTYECKSLLLNSTGDDESPTKTRPDTFPFIRWGLPGQQRKTY